MKKRSIILGAVIGLTLGLTGCATNDAGIVAYESTEEVEVTALEEDVNSTPIQADNQTETQDLSTEMDGEEISSNEADEQSEAGVEKETETEQQQASDDTAVASSLSDEYYAYKKGNVITIIKETSCPTKKPVTQAPTATAKPETTQTPVTTATPVVTNTPEATKAPTVTNTPVATKEPMATKTPVATKAPEATKAPVATTKPEATKTPTATKAPESDSSGSSNSSYASQVLALINEERAKEGLSALTTTTALSNAATLRAKELVSTFSHTRPDGTSGVTVLKEYSISYTAWGENIAYGQKSAAAVMNAWMNSSGHRANILSSKYGKVGIGCYEQNGVLYWTQVFTN